MRLFRQAAARRLERRVRRDGARCRRIARGRGAPRMIVTPCSIGELIDKITILRLKTERIADDSQARNVRRELALLELRTRERLVGGRGRAAGRPPGRGQRAALGRRGRHPGLRAQRRLRTAFRRAGASVYAANDQRAALKARDQPRCSTRRSSRKRATPERASQSSIAIIAFLCSASGRWA